MGKVYKRVDSDSYRTDLYQDSNGDYIGAKRDVFTNKLAGQARFAEVDDYKDDYEQSQYDLNNAQQKIDDQQNEINRKNNEIENLQRTIEELNHKVEVLGGEEKYGEIEERKLNILRLENEKAEKERQIEKAKLDQKKIEARKEARERRHIFYQKSAKIIKTSTTTVAHSTGAVLKQAGRSADILTHSVVGGVKSGVEGAIQSGQDRIDMYKQKDLGLPGGDRNRVKEIAGGVQSQITDSLKKVDALRNRTIDNLSETWAKLKPGKKADLNDEDSSSLPSCKYLNSLIDEAVNLLEEDVTSEEALGKLKEAGKKLILVRSYMDDHDDEFSDEEYESLFDSYSTVAGRLDSVIAKYYSDKDDLDIESDLEDILKNKVSDEETNYAK